MDAKLNNYLNDMKNSHIISTQESGETDLRFILPIKYSNGNRLINARDLHSFLEVKRDFSTWIKDRILNYDFIENKDFIVSNYDYLGNQLIIRLPENGESDNQRISRKEYGLTVAMAKELSMIENNEKGKQARRYFIKVEESMLFNLPNFNDPAEAAEEWAKQYRRADRAEKLALEEHTRAEQEKSEKETAIKTLIEKKEDLEFAESFIEPGENDMLVRQVACKLEQNGIIIAEKNLRKFLQDTKFFTKRVKEGQYEISADIVKKGYAYYRPFFVEKYSGERINKQTVYITGLGYKAIAKAIKTKAKNIFLKYGKFSEPYF